MTTNPDVGGEASNTNTSRPDTSSSSSPSAAATTGKDHVSGNGGSETANGTSSGAGVKLTIERAHSIGWYFIESYYELYNKNVENLYKLYNSDASIRHGDIPTISKSLCQGSGTDSIKALFNDVSSRKIKNKIIVVNADIQICMNNSILIVVTGEWSKNNSPYYQFNQTFVLCRGINESTFDIANDILRFIDYEFKHQTLADKKDIKLKDPVPEAEEPKADAKVANEENSKSTSKAPELDKQEVKQEQPVKSESTPEKVQKKELIEEKNDQSSAQKKEKTDKDEKEDSTEFEKVLPKEEKSDNESKSQSETEKENQEPEAGNQEQSFNGNGGPISWAALAATAKEKSPMASSKPSPNAVKSQPVTKKPAAQQTVTPLPNGKYKKEDWFPIYIRRCEELTEKDLRDHLTKKFGEIKFLRQNMNIALCDFLDSEGQRKALEAKKTVINGVEVSLEVRESKTSKKDKSKSDPKRKIDKKQPPKKK